MMPQARSEDPEGVSEDQPRGFSTARGQNSNFSQQETRAEQIHTVRARGRHKKERRKSRLVLVQGLVHVSPQAARNRLEQR